MRNIFKLIIISVGGLCLVHTANAQTDILDFSNIALQMSNTDPGGSARIRGLGGAQTALGGDISSVSSNPAGLGFFNRSEFSFTPNFNYINTSSDYLNQTTTDNKLNFNFANLGVVFNNTRSDIVESKWRGGNFGISLNRIADFNSNITYQAENRISDFIDYAVDADNFTGQTDLSDLAFNTFLTDQFYDIYSGQDSISINGFNYYIPDLYGNVQNGDSLFYVDRNIYRSDGSLAFPDQNNPTRQKEVINSRGASYQAAFSYGGNYNDKFYFGASLAILSYDQEVERVYTEEPTGADLGIMTLEDIVEQNGVGINATFGVIARPVTPLLLGISYTTPSYYAVEQLRTTSITAVYPGFDTEFDEIVYEPFDYSVTTPSRLKAGATYFFGKNGFITHEVEMVNYDGAKLRNSQDGFSFSENNQIINRFQTAYNFRSGIEFRFGKFRARGGFSYLGDPVEDQLDQSQMIATLGGGMRTKNYFVDLGITNTILGKENTISPYPGAEFVTTTTEKTKVAVTVGWFF